MRRGAGLAALLLLLSCREATPANAPDKGKPELFLLSALPLMWSESFGVDQPGSPALKALENVYRVTAIDLPSRLPEGGLMLAVQPRALPAEELVALDAWVRRGGRLVLLADPMLDWHSELPLGDRRRPPMAFPDTGLLQHWGLRLDAPEERGPKQLSLGPATILASSPGRLVRVGPGPKMLEVSGRPRFAFPLDQRKVLISGCLIENGELTARCRIGDGKAAVVADADFLNLGQGGLDGPTDGNLSALLSKLAEVSH